MFPGMIHNLDFSGQFVKPYLVHHIPLADPGQDILLSATIMVLKLLNIRRKCSQLLDTNNQHGKSTAV
jgi:hypothetical protein